MPPSDLRTIAKSVRAYLPAEDADADAEPLDLSFSSRVVALGGSVVRVARNEQAAAGHRREADLLPALAGRLPVAVAVPIRLVSPSDGLPFGAVIQPRLRGRTMTRSDANIPGASGELAVALAALHEIPPSDVPPRSIQRLDPFTELGRLERETFTHLERDLEGGSFPALVDCWRDARAILPGTRTVLAHGDPWYGNVLVDERGSPAALLDFEDACVADPALDLAALFHASRPIAQEAVKTYVSRIDPGPHLERRIESYRVFREVAGFAHLLRNEIQDELPEQLSKIEELVRG